MASVAPPDGKYDDFAARMEWMGETRSISYLELALEILDADELPFREAMKVLESKGNELEPRLAEKLSERGFIIN